MGQPENVTKNGKYIYSQFIKTKYVIIQYRINHSYYKLTIKLGMYIEKSNFTKITLGRWYLCKCMHFLTSSETFTSLKQLIPVIL